MCRGHLEISHLADLLDSSDQFALQHQGNRLRATGDPQPGEDAADVSVGGRATHARPLGARTITSLPSLQAGVDEATPEWIIRHPPEPRVGQRLSGPESSPVHRPLCPPTSDWRAGKPETCTGQSYHDLSIPARLLKSRRFAFALRSQRLSVESYRPKNSHLPKKRIGHLSNPKIVRLVVADEPTGNLDTATAAHVFQFLNLPFTTPADPARAYPETLLDHYT